jgi:hypothetical protein
MKTASPALINFLNEVIGFYDGQLVMAGVVRAEVRRQSRSAPQR